MKRFWMLLLVLVLALGMAVSVSAAEDHPHSENGHCVCGGAAVGVGDHTACQTVTDWTGISGAVDFGKLASGYYYLSGDVTVSGESGIGAKANSLATEPDKVVDLVICLNGYNITRQTGKVFGYLRMNSSLTICDCSYDAETGTFGGTVTGGVNNHGSIVYTYAGSVMNIYGGNFVGNANTSGGAIAIACDGCGDINGDGAYTELDRKLADPSCLNLYNGHITGSTVSKEGGSIVLYHYANMNMYGGTVTGGTAENKGGNIYVSYGKLCLTGGVISNGTSPIGAENAMVIRNDGTLVGTYATLAEAVEKAQSTDGTYVRLANDLHEEMTVSGELLLDLAGHDLSGVTITGKLCGMDSTTKRYDDFQAGTLTPVSGAPEGHIKTTVAQAGGIYRYLAVEDNGTYSFHRFYIGITKISLKPSTVGVGYKATFAGTDTVKALLDANQGYGYSLWLDGYSPVKRGYPASKFENVQELTLRIENFLSTDNTDEVNAERAEMDVHATAFIKLSDGTVISSSEVAYDFHEMLQLADDAYDTYTASQQKALQTLGGSFSQTMFTWDVSHIHHASGSIWEKVDTDSFTSKLTKSGSYYYIPTGNYVLTEDIDLAGRQLRVAAGKTVSICLNGYTLSDSVRVFRLYGNLNICDCHHDGEEGTILSTYDGGAEAATGTYYAAVFYAYAESVTNLYGGNLKATGTMRAAGVIAVSHDVKDKPDAPAAVFNMYGGTVSGGTAVNNAGLIALWNKGVFNMYGGKLYGGTAGTNGGGINVTGGCTFNLYGGQICGNTAGTWGGNISISNATLNMSGGTVTGGTAPLGGGVHNVKGTVELSGDARIVDNEGGNLHLDIYTGVDAQGLTSGAQVGLTVESSRVLGQDPAIMERVTCDDSNYILKQLYGNVSIVPVGTADPTDTTGFSVGFGQACITPAQVEGTPLSGYGNASERLAEAQELQEYDELMAQTVAITDEQGQTVLLIACDVIRPNADFTASITKAVTAATGVPEGNIIISCSHSHSTPEITLTGNALIAEYNQSLPNLFAQSAAQAMADRQQATMESGSFEVVAQINGQSKYLNFVRHYSYTDADGVLQYFGDNFGTSTYNSSTEHVWDADHTMHLVRFTRDGQDILMANWRIHPHRTGGFEKYQLSADIVGTTRYYMEQKTGDHFIYFNGAAGNVNSVSRLSKYNHGLDYVTYGEVLADCIIENLSCLQERENGLIQVDNYAYTAYNDHTDDDKYEAAVAFKAQFDEETVGMTSSEQAAYCKANGYSSIFEVRALISRYKRGTTTQLPLNVITVGNVFGLYTAPGELWDTVGIAVEEESPFATTFCLAYAQDHNNYFVYYPDSLDTETGVPYESYEYYNRRYMTPDTILDMIGYWTDTLQKLYDSAKSEINTGYPENPEGAIN